MALEERIGMNTKFTEGCWDRFILSGAYPYKILSGNYMSNKSDILFSLEPTHNLDRPLYAPSLSTLD